MSNGLVVLLVSREAHYLIEAIEGSLSQCTTERLSKLLKMTKNRDSILNHCDKYSCK